LLRVGKFENLLPLYHVHYRIKLVILCIFGICISITTLADCIRCWTTMW